MTRLFIALWLLMVSCAPAFAGDEELYDPAPPADSAFVRLINGTGAGKIGGIAGSLTFSDVVDFSAYQVLAAGDYEMSVNKAKLPLAVKAGGYYSVAYTKEKEKEALVVFEDPAIVDPAKAVIYFYNLSDKPASLRAPQYNTDILGNVAAGASSTKEINALALDIAVTVENVDVETFPGVGLKRRSGQSVLLTGAGLKYHALTAANNQARGQ